MARDNDKLDVINRLKSNKSLLSQVHSPSTIYNTIQVEAQPCGVQCPAIGNNSAFSAFVP